ncbi:MAG: tRNA pseudouridine(55) synthase TruB [Treponema sp.]|nr:tRNA pseudouridine(55) synthase TruB [Treponema sp.]
MQNTSANKIVLFSKEAGKTSFSSLFTVKKAFSTTKVGHTGTLDSFAEGLLVVCVGNLTRLAGKITEFDKVYQAVLLFGEETDTLECSGNVVKNAGLPTEEALLSAVKKFTGTYMQTPPSFSAIHVDGKRASDLVRSGQEVEIPSRSVTVFSSYIKEIMYEDGECRLFLSARESLFRDCLSPDSLNQASNNASNMSQNLSSEKRVKAALIEFHVSKGTYIRSLARDIALEASSVCHLIALRRTGVGKFSLNDAAGFENLSPFTIQHGFDNAKLIKEVQKKEKEEALKKAERKLEKREKGDNKKPYEPDLKELSLQEEIRNKSLDMSPALALECGFDLLTLKKESEDWFSHGGKLSSKMFTVSPFTLSQEIAAVFSETEEFKGLLQKDQNGYFKYSLVIN